MAGGIEETGRWRPRKNALSALTAPNGCRRVKNALDDPVCWSHPFVHRKRITRGVGDVQKRKERGGRPWYASPHFVLIIGVAGLVLLWLWSRDPGVKTLTYGEFMQIVRANDPAVHLHVKIGRSESHGVM